jgi:FixJ family two-component response regulator
MNNGADSTQNRIQAPDPPIVYLIDDDPSFLSALSRRLRVAGYKVETFVSAEQFRIRSGSHTSACAILDLKMPGLGGLELQELLARADEPLPVIFLTAHGDVPTSVRAMKQGAVDFLTKPVRGDVLLEAVQRALAHDAAIREMRRQRRVWSARYESLTAREREVFALVVRGMANKQVANVLQISERTVKAHRCQVMSKMAVQSPAELGRAAEWLGDFFQAFPAVQSASI